MDTLDLLNDDDRRQRMIDLCYSLYECLGDLMNDAIALGGDEKAIDYLTHRERCTMSAMNCLGDIELLLPIFNELSASRYVDEG